MEIKGAEVTKIEKKWRRLTRSGKDKKEGKTDHGSRAWRLISDCVEILLNSEVV